MVEVSDSPKRLDFNKQTGLNGILLSWKIKGFEFMKKPTTFDRLCDCGKTLLKIIKSTRAWGLGKPVAVWFHVYSKRLLSTSNGQSTVQSRDDLSSSTA